MVRLQVCLVVNDDVVGGSDSSLSNMLTDQEKVIPTKKKTKKNKVIFTARSEYQHMLAKLGFFLKQKKGS